mgnify:FL=1
MGRVYALRSVRIVYKKLGRMKFVSHLDMNRYIPRLVKVSKIPAWHTEGFNKHLYLTFALPLSLGITSEYDIFDLKITDDDFTDEMILEALKSNAAEGIEFVSCGSAVFKTAELSFASYTVIYKDSDRSLLTSLEKMLNGNVIIARKKGKKGKVTELNLAEKIKSINTELDENTLTLKVVLPAGNTENINPVLFLDAFESLGSRRPEVVTVSRDMLYTSQMEIFR